MTNASINKGTSNPLFHQAAHHDSAVDVLNDAKLTNPEKRIILSSWTSDMYAVDSYPSLREIPGLGRIRLADILAALHKLDDDDDDPPRGGGVPLRLRRPWAAAIRKRT